MTSLVTLNQLPDRYENAESQAALRKRRVSGRAQRAEATAQPRDDSQLSRISISDVALDANSSPLQFGQQLPRTPIHHMVSLHSSRLVVDGTMRRVAVPGRSGGPTDLAAAAEFFQFVASRAGINSTAAAGLLTVSSCPSP